MKRNTTTTSLLTLALMLLLQAGCTAKQHAFPNHSANQVWVAMQAVAESPEYDDWFLTTNEVWVDEEQSRIEVYRELRRTLHRPRSRPVNQRRTWRLQMTLEDQDPPTVRFVSRGWSVPAHAQEEADRYLVDVRRMLQSEFATQPQQAPAAQDETTTTTPTASETQPVDAPAEAPEVDIDDLS